MMKVSLRSQFLIVVIPFVGVLGALLYVVLAPYFAVKREILVERELAYILVEQRFADSFAQQTQEFADFLVTGTDNNAQEYRDSIVSSLESLAAWRLLNEKDHTDIAIDHPLSADHASVTELSERIIRLRSEGRETDATALLTVELRPLVAAVSRKLDQDLLEHERIISGQVARIAGSIDSSEILQLGGILIGIENLDSHLTEVFDSTAYKRGIEQEMRGIWYFFLSNDRLHNDIAMDHERVLRAFTGWRRAVKAYVEANPEEKEELEFVDNIHRQYLALDREGDHVVQLIGQGADQPARELLVKKLDFDDTALAKELLEYTRHENGIAAENLDHRRREADRARHILLVAATVILLVGLGVPWLFSRIMIKPILDLQQAALRVSRGDLDTRMTLPSTIELASLATTFNDMARELKISRNEDLRKSEERFQLAARSTRDMIWDWDVQTDKFWLDERFRETFGFRNEDFSSAQWMKATHPDDREAIGHSLETAITGSDHFWSAEFRLRRLDGTYAHMSNRGHIVRDADNKAIRMIGALTDVTVRHDVDLLKSQFVSTVSHELRTPLTSIRGALGLLSGGLLGKVSPKGQRMLEIAVSNTDRLVRLINDILDVERIESGSMEMSLAVIDALDLMTRAVEGIQSMADAAGVRLVVEPKTASLLGDRDRIIQTLTNLLGNAIKFSPRGTTVTLSATSDSGHCTFRVADQGRGVPGDKMEKIFERFQQVDASDTREKGGSGLGLAICRSIITAHGGQIWAQKNDPVGTVFQFTIPSALAPVSRGVRSGARTLVVCQEKDSAIPTIVGMLQGHGFHVLQCLESEVEGVVSESQPDAIILDLASNNGNGWQVVEALKSEAQTRNVPIVVATLQSPESWEKYAAAVASWVRRPFASADVLDAVVEACSTPSILVVEDDVDLARVMTAILQTHGIRTFHAANGRDAIDLCWQHEPSLIVLDLVLPDMDGFAVVSSLRESATLSRVPLLVYSGMDVGKADQERLRLGPTEFLTKSRASLQEFESRVVQLLDTIAPAKEEVLHAA